VLLIDDDMVSREVMATVLTMSGYTVHTADGGKARLSCWQAQLAPRCDPDGRADAGPERIPLVEQLRAQRMPPSMPSAAATRRELIAACDGFLLKPFTPEN
jgi:CheY-like chemotaxis protein